MWFSNIILALPLLTMLKASHVAKNSSDTNSDVIVTYAGHAEAIDSPKVIPITEKTTTGMEILIPESVASTVSYDEDTEGVVFVPNDNPVVRGGDYHDDRVNIEDVMRKKTIGDVLSGRNTRVETESPIEDIIFISGKNNENVDKPAKKEPSYEPNYQTYDTRRSGKEKTTKIVLDCAHLDCNNTLESLCGGKMENSRWKYRLFLNECYFRKVNCDFKYEVNRYKVVPDTHCKTVGSHAKERPYYEYNPAPPNLPRETPPPITNFRRSSSSRRSLNIQVDGTFCSHTCPLSCPDTYAPECAVTSRGQRRMFGNHCRLDHDSCVYGTVWHRRPLAECVGSQKADLRQNRAFIGWMQRVGIVDGKGRLVMA